MTEERQLESAPPALDPSWGAGLEAGVCENCDWSFLTPIGSLPRRCPHCFAADLSPLGGSLAGLPYTLPPELIAPHAATQTALASEIAEFAQGIPFAPVDLTAQNLQKRLCKLYLPRWLVDATVKASWKAEAGYDYQVVSHQDRYDENRGGWASREVKEGRIRWEPRLGKLERSYQNIPSPALEEEARLRSALGGFDAPRAVAYRPDLIRDSLVRLPDRTPERAWTDAAPAMQAAAAEEVRQAAGAQHLRAFSWQPETTGKNWTLLLQPVYSTYYLDDEKNVQPVLIHGETGQVSGARRASMQRAQRMAGILVGVALVIFLISLLASAAALALPPLLALGVAGIVLAVIIGLGAIIPLGVVWQFNRSHAAPAPSHK